MTNSLGSESTQSAGAAEGPGLSLIIPIQGTALQTENALSSLCAPYQSAGESVEILVVEASSSDMLGETRARAHGESVRYVALEAPQSARTRSIELGLRESRATFVGVFMRAVFGRTIRSGHSERLPRAFARRGLPVRAKNELPFPPSVRSRAGRARRSGFETLALHRARADSRLTPRRARRRRCVPAAPRRGRPAASET
jgi:hypothetical protein